MASELTPYQKDILIKTALGEARGEGVEGMADVMQVILNRANSGQFPSDPAKVALQSKQFSTWNSGAGGNNPSQFQPGSQAYQTAEQALEAVMGGRADPTGGALYYHTPSVNPSWASAVNTNGTIQRNGHVFYPQGEVGTQLDTQRSSPSLMAQSPLMAQSRAVTSPSGGNTALQEALNQYATRERNRVTPMAMQGTTSTVASFPTVAQAPTTRTVQSRSVPSPSVNDAARRAALSIGSNQTYAGAERAPVAAPRTVSTADAARRAALSIGANQSFAGQERAPVTTRAAVPMAMGVNQSYAGQDRAPVARTVPGPTAAVKTAQRLMPSSAAMAFNPLATGGAVQSGGLSRDALARQASYNATALNPPAARLPSIAPAAQVSRQAPTPFARPQTAAPIMASSVRQPVAVAPMQPAIRQPQMPLMAQQPLQVLVQGLNTVQPVQPQLSPAQAYAAANAQAQQLARSRATSPRYQSSNDYFNRVTSGGSGSSTRGDTVY